MAKKICTVLCAVLSVILALLIWHEKKIENEISAVYKEMSVETRPFSLQVYDLKQQIDDLEDEASAKQAGTATSQFLVTDLSARSYAEIMSPMVDYGYPVGLALSLSEYPGAEGCLTADEALALADQGWYFCYAYDEDEAAALLETESASEQELSETASISKTESASETAFGSETESVSETAPASETESASEQKLSKTASTSDTADSSGLAEALTDEAAAGALSLWLSAVDEAAGAQGLEMDAVVYFPYGSFREGFAEVLKAQGIQTVIHHGELGAGLLDAGEEDGLWYAGSAWWRSNSVLSSKLYTISADGGELVTRMGVDGSATDTLDDWMSRFESIINGRSIEVTDFSGMAEQQTENASIGARTPEDTQAQISELEAQVEELEAQIENIQDKYLEQIRSLEQ